MLIKPTDDVYVTVVDENTLKFDQILKGKQMVKEITAYKDEITGKIFKTFEEAQKSEEKAKRLTEEKEIQNFANDLAKRYG